MPYIGAVRAHYTKEELRSPEFTLPPLRVAPSIIKSGWYTWELEPYIENEERVIKLTCSNCRKCFPSSWPVKLSSRIHHYKKCRSSSLYPQQENNSTSEDPNRGIISSTDGGNSSSTMTPYATNSSSCGMEADCTGVGKKRPASDLFDAYEFRKKLIEFFLSSSDASFQLLKCPYFLDLLKSFDSSVSNTICLPDIRSQLECMYASENNVLRSRLAKNESRYAIIINEWIEGHQYSFAMATLQFYNADFSLERYIIGLEASPNKSFPHAGQVLCERLFGILEQLEINNRIISITRDDIMPLEITAENPAHLSCANIQGLELPTNERTVSYYLKLAARVFFDYTFFTKNTTESFKESLEKIAVENPHFKDFSERVKALPREMQSIMDGIQTNTYLKSTFNALVNKGMIKEKIESGLSTPLSHRMFPFLSVHRKLSQFIHYQWEFTQLLKQAKSLPKFERDKLDLLTFEITDDEWDYLVCVRDILAIFSELIIDLQPHNSTAITHTLPYVYKMLESLHKWNLSASQKGNPYVALGVQKAYGMLLEQYFIFGDQERPTKNLHLATVLDPRFKLGFFSDLCFSTKAIERIRNQLYNVYEVYKSDYERQKIAQIGEIRDATPGKTPPNCYVGNKEVYTYLSEKRALLINNVVDFYRNREGSFPILYRMAKDFFATPPIYVPTEPSFASSDIPTGNQNLIFSRGLKMKENLKSPTELEMKVIINSRGPIAGKINVL